MTATNPSSEPSQSEDKPAARPSWTEFRWYLGGHGSYFVAMGIQGVAYPLIVTFILNQNSDVVGIVQMFTMLPMFGLVLLGGMTADRKELRMHLVRLQFLAAVPMLFLATLIFTDTLTLTLLILCGLATGSVGAFLMPARDSLLNRVARRSPSGDIQQAVNLVIGIQFASNLLGIFLASQFAFAGPAILLLALACVYLFGAFCTTHVKPAPPHIRDEPDHDGSLSAKWKQNVMDIAEGITEVRQSKRMFPVICLMFSSGLLIMGVFSVLLQMLVRDVYNGTIEEYSVVMMCFTIGITVTTLTISRIKNIIYQGRAMMLSFLGGTLVLSMIHFEPPLWGVYTLILLWGACAGVSMSMSRSIVQEAASATHRARVMSVYQLGFLGGAPLGALGMGYVTKWLGPLDAALVAVIGMLIVWGLLLAFTTLWDIKRENRAHEM